MFEKLFKTIKDRKEKMPEGSYTTSLFKEGRDRISQKVGEEVVEVVIASKNPDKPRVVSEIADLWFHLFVLMVDLNISIEDIDEELTKRSKTSKK